MPKLDIHDYAPDLAPTTSGIMTSCLAIVPSLKGMKAAPSAEDVGLNALAAACVGGAVVRKLDNSTRLIAGTATAIYENVSGATWTDRTRAVGGAYGLGSSNRWSIAQFGDVTLMAAKTDTLQASSSGALANVTGAPKASIVETVGQFVVLLDTNESIYGDSPNRWYCAGIGTHTDWTPAIATQCASGLLTSSSGPIRAGRRLGESIIAYKDRSMFMGIYVGPPTVWDWREISDSIGVACQELVVPIVTASGGSAHIFLSNDDFYYFDGSRPIPIPNPVKTTIINNISKSFFYKCWSLHDRVNSLIYFYYPSTAVGTIDSCVVYNYRKDDWINAWGRDDRTIEACIEYVTAGVTYDGLGALYATYDTPIPFSYDSPYWVSGYPIPAVFNTSHKINTLTGVPGSATFTLADMGDDDQMICTRRLRPRYLSAPSTASLQNAYKMLATDAFTNDGTTTLASGKFDFMREARWHRLTHVSAGAMELPHSDGMSLDFEVGGDE